MDRIDFRSDTVTWPTEAMREAMARAPLGDDVYGEDPTVGALERLAARRTGKEAGLFVASGTMGNLVAILVHAGRGEEALVGVDAHTLLWEAGGMATLGGVLPHALPTDAHGRIDLGVLEGAVRPDAAHLPRTRLILVETSYGSRDGYPLGPDYLDGVRAVADRHGLAMHLDGARLFNAAVALGLDASEVARAADSVTFCLSKGLCAPVGSVLCGSAAFVHEARRVRKSLGGGMRQAGVLAAAGLVALETMVDRLAEDHARARLLAEGLAAVPGVRVEVERIRTNIVHFELDPDLGVTAKALVTRLRDEHGLWIGAHGPTLRAVTHYWIADPEVHHLLQAVRTVVA